MGERKPEEAGEIINLEVLLERLQENMRHYDELVQERDLYTGAVQKVNESLLGVDLENTDDNDVLQLTRHKVLLDGKIVDLEKQMLLLRNPADQLSAYNYYYKKINIKALDPRRAPLGRLTTTDHGVRTTGASKAESKKGRLLSLSLNADIGGNIDFKTRLGQEFSTGPLFDRKDNYEPLFEVTLLEE